jgi:hypothetical protein
MYSQYEPDSEVDMDEFCDEWGVTNDLPFRATLTRNLCLAIEKIPLRLVHQTSVAQRIRELLSRAQLALARHMSGTGKCMSSFTLRFAAPLPSAGSESAWRILRIQLCTEDSDGPNLILGLANEALATQGDQR